MASDPTAISWRGCGSADPKLQAALLVAAAWTYSRLLRTKGVIVTDDKVPGQDQRDHPRGPLEKRQDAFDIEEPKPAQSVSSDPSKPPVDPPPRGMNRDK